MAELSIFIDESGDFGKYTEYSPYYIITLVFHNQDIPIKDNIKKLDLTLSECELGKHTVHTGPLIRKKKLFTC